MIMFKLCGVKTVSIGIWGYVAATIYILGRITTAQTANGGMTMRMVDADAMYDEFVRKPSIYDATDLPDML